MPGGTSVTTTIEMPKPADEKPAEKETLDFWTYMARLTPEEWKGHIIYLTREQPKTTINGVGGYLTKLMQPFDIEDIKQAYGGREFSYIMKNEKGSIIYSGKFNVEAPPRFDAQRESPGGGSNGASSNDGSMVKEFVSVLREELQRSREANSLPNPGTEEAITLLSKASERAMEIVSKQVPQGSSSTAQLAELVTIVKGMMPPPPPSGGLDLMVLLKPLIEKLLTPPDPLAELAKLKSAMDVLDSIRGGATHTESTGKARDWKAMLAEGLIQKGPELLEKLRDTADAAGRAAEARRAAAVATQHTAETIRNMAPPNAPAAPANGTTTVMPAAGPLRTVPINRGNGEASVTEAVNAASAEAAPPAAPGMNTAESEIVANFMERRIVEMIEEGRDAEDVVDFIEDVDHTLNDMLAGYTADIVTTFLAGRPIIGRATKLPGWTDFLRTAQAYIKEIREEDKAIETAAAAAPV
jgi:ribosomal protein S17E